VILAAIATGCGGSGSSEQPVSTAATAAVTPTVPATAPTAPVTAPPAAAELDKRLPLAGILEGERVAVTLLEIRDTVEVTSETPFEPAEGNRFYAVRLRVENIGSIPTNESPLTAGELFVDGAANGPELLSAVKPDFEGNPTIAPRGRLEGWLTFEIPASAVPQRLRYTPRAKFARQSGTWRLS
jgi:hypothetical protein